MRTKKRSKIDSLRDMTQVACANGTWNFDPYLHGMANGMIFALSIFEGGEPKYLSAPKKWLKDVKLRGKAVPEVVRNFK